MKDLLVEKMYEATKKPYQKWLKKNEPWNISIKDLLQYSENSLGFHLGCFLCKHDFEIQDKLEDHDVFHVLTNTGISVVEEIGMQFYLLGNGKRSLYLLFGISVGILFYPTQIRLFIKQFKRGKKAHPFYNLNFINLLHQDTTQLQKTFNIQ